MRIKDMVNVAHDIEVDEIIQNPPEDPQIFEVLRCYLEHLEGIDTKHVARYIIDFCLKYSDKEFDQLFFFKAAEAAITALGYSSINADDFADEEFFTMMIEFVGSGFSSVFSKLLLKGVFKKLKFQSIDFLSEEDITSIMTMLIEIQNATIQENPDKTNICDMSAFLVTQFACVLTEFPQTEELLGIVSENIQLALSSKHPEIVNFAMNHAFSLLKEEIGITIHIPSLSSFGEKVAPMLLNICTVLDPECFEGGVYPFSFDDFMTFSLPSCPFFITAQNVFCILMKASVFSAAEATTYFTTLLELVENEETENPLPFTFSFNTVSTLSAFDPSILIANPGFIHVFYKYSLNENSECPCIVIAILMAALTAVTTSNTSFISAFLSETSSVIDELGEIVSSGKNSEKFVSIVSQLIEVYDSLSQ